MKIPNHFNDKLLSAPENGTKYEPLEKREDKDCDNETPNGSPIFKMVFLILMGGLLYNFWFYEHFNAAQEYHNYLDKLDTLESISELDGIPTIANSHHDSYLEHPYKFNNNRPLPNAPGSEECHQILPDFRFDCHPDSNPNAQTCEQRGCCWNSYKAPSNTSGNGTIKGHPPLDVPYCFYPKNYSLYTFSKVRETVTGVSANLTQTHQSGFPNDYSDLAFEAYFLDCTTLRIKIYSARNKVWESPLPRIKKEFEKCSTQKLYSLELFPKSSNFLIRRTLTGTPVFDTRSAAPLISSYQFVQLSTFLPSPYIYGLGQHLDGLLLDVNWHRRVLWNVDQWNIPKANLYGSHPFYTAIEPSGDTHGVFLLNSNAMDVVLQPAPAATFHITGGIVDLFVFLGPTLDHVVQQYMQVIGTPFLPPYWSLGYHQCRFGYNDLSDTKEVYERTRKAMIPFDVQWNDIDYMKSRNDFTYDNETYFGLPEFVTELHQSGMHYVVINDAAIGAGETPGSYPPFDDGLKRQVFISNSSGQPFVGKVWNLETSVWPDFTNPTAIKYWIEWLKKFHDEVPYDGLWLDMNEPSNFWAGQENGCPISDLNDPPYLPPVVGDTLYHKTVCPSAQHAWGPHYFVHNLYGLTEVVATYQALRLIRQNQRPFIISRSTFPGSGSVGGHWTGDVVSDWFNLRRSVADILTTSMMGIPMVGADICGFNGNTTRKLCNRWMQLGAFYPFSRNHNTDDAIAQDPVAMGAQVLASSKKALLIRYRLLPYFYSLFFRAHASGQLVIKPLFANYPQDRQTYTIDTQLMWGEALMVIPVLEEDALEVDGYLPAGRWYSWDTKTSLTDTGTLFVTFAAPLDTIPLAINSGHIIPLQEPDVTTTQSRKNPFGLLVALNASGAASGFMVWDDGQSVAPLQKKAYLEFKFESSQRHLQITPSVLNWMPTENMVLGWIEVWGIEGNVTQVVVNKDTVNFVFNSKSKTLMIENLSVEMLPDQISASW